MATSGYQNSVFVLQFLERLFPESILDVGAGFGKWGFLCRCHLGLGLSVKTHPDERLKIDCIEAYQPNVTPLYDVVYNKYYIGNAKDIIKKLSPYDVIICGDMIEHLEKQTGQALLDDMLEKAKDAVILIFPFGKCEQGALYGNPYEVHKSTWDQGDFKRYDCYLKKHKFNDKLEIATVIFPRSDRARWLLKIIRNPLRSVISHLLARTRGE